jgi:hypothetical protein
MLQRRSLRAKIDGRGRAEWRAVSLSMAVGCDRTRWGVEMGSDRFGMSILSGHILASSWHGHSVASLQFTLHHQLPSWNLNLIQQHNDHGVHDSIYSHKQKHNPYTYAGHVLNKPPKLHECTHISAPELAQSINHTQSSPSSQSFQARPYFPLSLCSFCPRPPSPNQTSANTTRQQP